MAQSEVGKYLNKILLHRWEAAGLIFCVLLGLACWQVCFPLASGLKNEIATLGRDFTIMNSADSLEAMIASVRNEAAILDSEVNTVKESEPFTEGTLPGVIYDVARKAGVKASKVEISVATEADGARQLPVRFCGSGEYAECGRFIDGVESLKPAACIKDLALKKTVKGNIDLTLDFIVVSPVK
jgi:Tfp pilus assembly protein PilO